MFDYEALRIIWWLLLGVLLGGFAVMDGFDMGVAIQLPFVARTDAERRVAINTIGPVWEGNQVWLILGAGAIFAAWPPLYAVSFSGFYPAMFLVLSALILRPVGFKFRSKLQGPLWRSIWDWALFVGGFVPSLVFGVAVGNALQGANFWFDSELRIHSDISLISLLNPFGLLCGLVSVSMLTMHGAAYLSIKAGEPVRSRASIIGRYAAFATIALFAVSGIVIATQIEGYRITSEILTGGPSNPLAKTVVREAGAWLSNYSAHPWMILAPSLGFLGAIATAAVLGSRFNGFAIVFSGLSVFGVVSTAGVSMFPFLLPSAHDLASSLTVWDGSSSRMTLLTMLIATAVFMPIILLYTAWVYRVLWGRVTVENIARDPHGHY